MRGTDRSAEHLWHEFRANAAADVTMSLLRSNDALLHLALMAAHLGDGQIVDGETLTGRIEADLAGPLRSYVPSDDDPVFGPAPDADALLTRWTKKGWVHRSIDPETRLERYQLTSGASQAVRQMRNLRRQTSLATESALSMVMAEMRQIASDANPDPQARRQALDEQIAMLVAQREALDSGEAPAVDQRELVDKVTALTQLTERIPSDIARYGEQMQANTTSLIRQSLADDPAAFAESLDRMFEGHDVISESAEGQAFRAFATLIATPSQRAQLESDIAEVISHVHSLPPDIAESLSGFIDAMWNRVQEVEDARAVAFRRMNNFVRGGDALHYRSMRTLVSEAQAAAAEAFQHTHGGRDIGFAVPMSGADTSSVGRLRLSEGAGDPPDSLADGADEFTVDPASLVGQESIDWAALRSAVNAALDAVADDAGRATLPHVLERIDRPRTGDVIGLWSLATRHGDVDPEVRVTTVAYTSHGAREITLPAITFAEPVPDSTIAVEHHRTLSKQPLLLEASLVEDTVDA
ncbi:DUF3375 family protein [Phytoactinopolyspora halotolerans]|uniref:DUF3375 family protein n=1 Tax=Phytoactinopolyspora halotolerans TaxID=1981512 RepID=A0A6L9S0E6_9ACTN|nr:DUF3375 family protein [Phytoactinopolyspora halotolerans]NED98592.1 DUF3375 family protein [Phytoactinopolyspora halotolerans]